MALTPYLAEAGSRLGAVLESSDLVALQPKVGCGAQICKGEGVGRGENLVVLGRGLGWYGRQVAVVVKGGQIWAVMGIACGTRGGKSAATICTSWG